MHVLPIARSPPPSPSPAYVIDQPDHSPRQRTAAASGVCPGLRATSLSKHRLSEGRRGGGVVSTLHGASLAGPWADVEGRGERRTGRCGSLRFGWGGCVHCSLDPGVERDRRRWGKYEICRFLKREKERGRGAWPEQSISAVSRCAFS